MYGAGNPVYFYDDDGRKIRGFRIDRHGNIKINEKKVSATALRVYYAMMLTEAGAEAFKEMIKMPTVISFKITEDPLENGNHGKTIYDIRERTLRGYVTFAEITISIYRSEDRFADADEEEIINAVGSHEFVHLLPDEIRLRVRLERMERKRKLSSDVVFNKLEQKPVMYELYSRLQYKKRYGEELKEDVKRRYQKFLGNENYERVLKWFNENKTSEIWHE